MRPDQHWLQRAAAATRLRFPDQQPTIALLPPHGSLRRYARVSTADTSLMLMLLPDANDVPPDVGTAHPEAVCDEPFIAVAHWLQAADVPAPRVLGFDQHLRILWISDLGDTTFFDAIEAAAQPRLTAYAHAIGLLERFQRANSHPEKPAIVGERALDFALLHWELEHYVDWRLQQKLGVALSTQEREALDRAFDWLAHALCALPQTTVHRDFQSHNVMQCADGSLALLDFQDALQGPLPYDAVALLRDSYIELTDAELDVLVDQWATATLAVTPALSLSYEALVRAFHLQTVQRKLKDTGRFELFDRQKGQPEYLKFQPASVRYIRHALSKLSDVEPLQGLHDVLARHEPLYR